MGEQEKSSGLSPRMKNGLKFIITIVALLIAMFLVARLALTMLPFTLALVVGQLLEPMIRFLMRRLCLKRRWIATILSILLYALLVWLTTIGVMRIISEVANLVRNIPNFAFQFTQWMESTAANFQELLQRLDPAWISMINNTFNAIFQGVTGWARSLATMLVSGVSSLPRMILFFVVMIISTVLFTSDRDKMLAFARKHLPDAWIKGALGTRDDLLGALAGYFRAQATIMLFIFVELFIGFTIVGSDYALLIALGTAVLDALPVFGAGAVLIPTALISAVMGDYRLGIGAAIMYVVTLMLRQMLEPKVLGDAIGLHPLLTLAAVYVGFKTIGVVGMILGPIVVLILKNFMTNYMGGRTLNEVLDGVPRKRYEKPERSEKKPGLFAVFMNKQKTHSGADRKKRDSEKKDKD